MNEMSHFPIAADDIFTGGMLKLADNPFIGEKQRFCLQICRLPQGIFWLCAAVAFWVVSIAVKVFLLLAALSLCLCFTVIVKCLVLIYYQIITGTIIILCCSWWEESKSISLLIPMWL